MVTRRSFAAVILAAALTASAQQPAELTVDVSTELRTVNPWLYGINTARWDESLFPATAGEMLLTCDRDAVEKIRASGVTVLKYPGGNDADSYVWNSPNNPAEMDTDEYIALCRAVGAEPFITVNFNAPPALAAEWVRYCNLQRGYAVKLWEVGDEQWGTWAKGHAPPEEYAKKYTAFVRAMKAVDPSILVATNVPLGPHPEDWTRRVLTAAGNHVDLLTFTYFPQQWGKENDDSLFASVPRYISLVDELRRSVEAAVGGERAGRILLINVGYNSVNHSPGPQTVSLTNALWVADMLGAMAVSGTDMACYWAIHNAFPPRGGDYGYLSSEGSNTPRYSYYVFPLFRRHFGDKLVRAVSTDPFIRLYAATSGKRLTVVAVNLQKEEARRYQLAVRGFTPRPVALARVLDICRKGDIPETVRVSGTSLVGALPAFSVTALEFVRDDSVDAPVNLALSARATASSWSVIGPWFTPASGNDGLVRTRWNSAAWTKSDGDEPGWYQLAWERAVTVCRVRIHWGESPAILYTLEGSMDGISWSTLREAKGGTGGVEEAAWDPREVKYLRVNAARGTKGISAYSIVELEVF